MFSREIALYQALHRSGVEVTFVTYGRREEVRFATELAGIQVLANRMGLSLRLYQKALKLLPPRGNIFKSNQVAGADVALTAARRRGAKFIARCGYLLSEFEAHKHGAGSSEAERARQLELKVFASADRVAVTTEAMSRAVIDQYGIGREKVKILPNYVETKRFKPMAKEPSPGFRIGFVGRMDEQKNLMALIEATSDLDIELLLVGQGPQLDVLVAAAKHGRAKVHFKGKMPNAELPKFLNTCDLFVLPSLYEGHPKSLLEAMACGLPVIGTRVPGIRELIADGENGLLCDTDANSLREVIQRAMNDPALRLKMGKRARTYIEKNFSLERVVDLELSLYRELIS